MYNKCSIPTFIIIGTQALKNMGYMHEVLIMWVEKL